MVTVAVALAGCAPSLATLQPAHVAPAGHVQATAGFEVAVPRGTITKIVDLAETTASQAATRMLTDAEIARLFDAGISLAVSPVSVGQHFALAYSVVNRTELAVRYAGGGWRLGGRYQILKRESDRVDMVVGLGVTRATTHIPLSDVIPYLDSRQFTRWTLDLPLLIGTSGSWYRVWGGPKLLYSRFETSLSLALPMNPAQVAVLEGHAYYFGGQGGLAVGYRNVFLGLELTVCQLAGSASVSPMLSAGTSPTDISGLVVYPAFALMAEF